jgi:hypothetical protein
MRLPVVFLTLQAAACDPDPLWCGKVMCEAGDYCLHDGTDIASPTDEPDCAEAPAACDGEPSCDCLASCAECTEEPGKMVHCIVE